MITDFNTLLLLIVKIMSVIGSLLYLVFAFIIVKQVSMMTKNVSDKFNSILVTFSWLHLVFAAFFVFLTLTVL
jgi:hypothetical protein